MPRPPSGAPRPASGQPARLPDRGGPKGSMAIWQWLADSAGFVLLLVLLYGLALVVRRRTLSRHGGTFELSVRVRSTQAGRGWVLGLGRYDGERLEWFRIFSVVAVSLQKKKREKP